MSLILKIVMAKRPITHMKGTSVDLRAREQNTRRRDDTAGDRGYSTRASGPRAKPQNPRWPTLTSTAGIFKDHVVQCATAAINADGPGQASDSAQKTEADHRFQAMTRQPSLRHFKKGISLISRWTGNEYRDMEKVFLSDIASAFAPVLGFVYYAHYEEHTNESLRKLEESWRTFHVEKDVFVELGIRDHFNIPKIHSMSHYPSMIHSHGSAGGYNTEVSEHLHIDASTKKGYARQMTAWMRRREAVEKFQMFLQYAIDEYGEQESEEEDEDEDDVDVMGTLILKTATAVRTLSTAVLYGVAGGIHGLGTYTVHGSRIPVQCTILLYLLSSNVELNSPTIFEVAAYAPSSSESGTYQPSAELLINNKVAGDGSSCSAEDVLNTTRNGEFNAGRMFKRQHSFNNHGSSLISGPLQRLAFFKMLPELTHASLATLTERTQEMLVKVNLLEVLLEMAPNGMAKEVLSASVNGAQMVTSVLLTEAVDRVFRDAIV
ncbi:hypothetical protein ARMSODRAFT_1070873 [Armillaria solidipes]|uniref:Uncharacterized protein n=1 Tax=Armillaria solidipes TaxID=1076256 RepID=A0A2H3AYH5_9AGAR|nr:hypothetical protein ARMSODRAFT_1070873 [Armillaria solidipes]